MQPAGLCEKEILDELKKIHMLNKKYVEGRILCSMCTEPLPVAKKAYEMFFETNLGDSGLFPGAARVEKEVIVQLAYLLNNQNAIGFLVSGGTEANLIALLAARNIAKIKKPEVVLGESAHFSFTKICNMLNIKPVFVKLNSSFGVNISEVEKKVTKNTIAIVGTAGTTELGVIDPIDKLSEISIRRNVWLHVDAAFGGLVIPFLNRSQIPFDFSLEGVKSITVDPHKMGMAAIPTGGLLLRDESSLNFIKVQTPYLTDKDQYTFVGTRTGASAASAWAVFKLLGFQGFQKIVKSCIKNTKLLSKNLKRQGFKLVVDPKLNLLAFRSGNSLSLARNLINRGWYVSYVPRYDCIRIVVMPHVKRRHILTLLKDLQTEKL